MALVTFTFEQVKQFNAANLESTLDTQERLYLVGFGRVNELKADIARYLLQVLGDEDHSYFMWYSAQVNRRIVELSSLGCEEAVARFFDYGYWT
jgi:hypothetical protein